MLVVVTLVFATLWLPYRGMLLYNSFATLYMYDRFMDLWFLMFAKTCIYINRWVVPGRFFLLFLFGYTYFGSVDQARLGLVRLG